MPTDNPCILQAEGGKGACSHTQQQGAGHRVMSVNTHIASSGLLAAEYICLLADWFSLVLAGCTQCSCGRKFVADADIVFVGVEQGSLLCVQRDIKS